MHPTTPAQLLIEARERAGLSQRTLARRARTSQSVIARIENGTVSPSWTTLQRLLRRSGFELQATLVPKLEGRSHMLADVPRILRLTPEQRLLELRNAARFFGSAVRKSLEDILRSKQASHRPQDLQDVVILREMLKRR